MTKFKQTRGFVFWMIIAINMLSASVYAEIPQTVNFQGFLTNQANQAVDDGSYLMTFSLWDGPDNQNDRQLWSENQNVQVIRGIYSVALGSSNAFPNTLTFADECYLGVQVDGRYLKLDDHLIPLTTTWTAFRSQTSAGRIIKTVSDDYAVAPGDDIICVNGGFTIILPDANGCSGKIFTIENVGTASVSIQTNGSQTIDDDTSITLEEKYAQVTLVSNGSGWYRLGASGSGSIDANSIGYTELAPGAVQNSELADDAVTTTKLLDGAVTTNKLFDDAITASKLADDSVTASKLADDAVTTSKIAGENANGKVITTDGSGNSSWNYVKNAIQEFTVKAGETITAGDIVTYINGTIQKGVGGQTSDFSVTDPYTMNTGDKSVDNAVARLSDSKFVVSYMDDYVAVKVGTLVGTSISWGNTYSFSSNNDYSNIRMKALSSSKIVIYYKQSSAGGHVSTAIIGEINGDVISFGAPVDMTDAVKSFTYASLTVMSSSKFVVDYCDANGPANAVVVGKVNGTTITKGSKYSYTSNRMAYHNTVAALNESKFVIAYSTIGPNNAFCMVGDINDTTVSWGDNYTMISGQAAFYNSIEALNENTFALAFQDLSNSNYGTAVIGEVNGTAISLGNLQVIMNAVVDKISLSKINETRIVIAFQNGRKGEAIVGDINGTTITWGNANSFFSDYIAYPSCESINESQFVVAYQYDNYNGFASVGSLMNISSTGIASTGGTGGDTVQVVFSGVVDGMNGLSANSKYYADDNGNLTTTETERYIGTALSTTSLLIQSAFPGAQAIEDGKIVASKLSGTGGTGLGNGLSGQVLQSNADGTFSWADMIRLTPQSSAPVACDASTNGIMVLTTRFQLCVCSSVDGGWRKIEAEQPCIWPDDI
jgi:hypothetical protein